MIVSFGSRGAEDILYRINSAAARRCCPIALHDAAREKLETLDTPGNRLEPLRGRLQGWHSIRINDQWRIIFRWTDAGPDGVEIVDYHD